MEMKGFMGGFHRIAEWIMRLSSISVFWFLCSAPVWYGLFVFVHTYSTELTDEEAANFIVVLFNLLPMLTFVPFTLFPATSAAFAVARKWVMGDTDVPLIRTYFKAWKSNYLYSMYAGLLAVAVSLVMAVSINFYSEQESGMAIFSIVCLITLVVLIMAVLNFFNMVVHFDMKFWKLISNAILFTIGRPLNSIMLLLVNAAIIYFSFTVLHLFPVVFFMGAMIALMSFWLFYRVYVKLVEQDQANQDANIVADGNNPLADEQNVQK